MGIPVTDLSGQVSELDRDVVALKVANASLATTVAMLAGEVSKLRDATQKLETTMATGRGALWLFLALAGAVGGLVSAGIKAFAAKL